MFMALAYGQFISTYGLQGTQCRLSDLNNQLGVGIGVMWFRVTALSVGFPGGCWAVVTADAQGRNTFTCLVDNFGDRSKLLRQLVPIECIVGVLPCSPQHSTESPDLEFPVV